jgi:hypothetical protein
MKKLLVFIATLMCLTQVAFGYSFGNKGKCAYSKEVLQNPDLVIQYQLENTTRGSCDTVWKVKAEIYPEAKTLSLPKGLWGLLHPKNKIFELATKYPEAMKEPFFEPMAGGYREYKILNKQVVSPIEDMEAIEYTVELLYVSLNWARIPKVNDKDGKGWMPVCERNTIKLYAVNTPLGWYMVNYFGDFGEMHDPAYTRLRNGNYYKSLGKNTEEAERYMKRHQQVIDECKDHLN